MLYNNSKKHLERLTSAVNFQNERIIV